MSGSDLTDELRRAKFHERENYARWRAAEAQVAIVRDRLRRLADDQRAALECAGSFETHLVAAVNLYSDACREIEAALSGEHDCATCPDCLHDGRKCCGCYDGACCKERGDE